MKKFFNIIIGLFCVCFSVLAQNGYYYYHGTKVPLNEDATKVVSISSKSENIILSPSNGFTLISTISDSRSNIKVYELASSISASDIFAAPASTVAGLQMCFITESGNELIPNGYINVKLKKSTDYTLLVNIAKQYGCDIVEQNSYMPLWFNLHVIAGRGNNSVDVANAIYETGNFASAFPSFSFDALEISYDPNVYEQWGLYNSQYEDLDISISKAWSYATGRGIKIAIVDQGIDLSHLDLIDNISSLSYDTETNTSPSKLYGVHGTHCAGIAAAVRNNGIQVAGVAPDAKLMSVSNTLSGLDNNIEEKLANGINWAWQNGADIISCSWWCEKNEMLEEAIDNAVSKGREGKGCVFVKSAGNTSGPISYTGDYSPDVIAVANMTINGSLLSSSGRGQNLFVTAPGTDILSTLPNNKIGKMSGTSMACPHVAGLAALILERNPKLIAVKVREIIAKNTKKVGSIPYNITKVYGTWNERYGYGLIDAYEAVINTPRN